MADDFYALVKSILQTPRLQRAPQRIALLNYLWKNWQHPSLVEDIWQDALRDHTRSKGKDDEGFDVGNTVRKSCGDLRKVLNDHFANAREGWIIDLPDAVPSAGYRLEFLKLNDPEGAARLFWQAHLHPPHNVYVVYTEQLFYQHWPERFTFRYFDLNAENEKQALTELREQHPETYREGLVIAHPYVSYGEIEARDALMEWFAKNAMVKVKPAVTRRMNDREVVESSLILFRSAATNRITDDILRSPVARHLGFRIQQGGAIVDNRRYGRVVIKDPTDEEMQRLAPYNPVRQGTECLLDFSPEQGTDLAILSRVQSPYADTAITIFNTESGRAVKQIAALLTSEERMIAGIKQLNWPVPMPASFEILYAIPIGSIKTDDRRAMLEPLAWRTYGS